MNRIQFSTQELKNKKIIIKIGSQGLRLNDSVDLDRIASIVAQIAELKKLGAYPLLVSSGAVACGRSFVKKTSQKKDISYSQTCASIGQPLLIHAYSEAFKKHGLYVAQMLVTHDDFRERKRFLNMRNTGIRLLEEDIIPIINENDTVSFEEITTGDNDQLASMMAQLIGADIVVFLTQSPGVFDKHPEEKDAKRFEVLDLSKDLSAIDTTKMTSTGRGGMTSKLDAAKKCTQQGIHVYITSYESSTAVKEALTKNFGTYCLPAKTKTNARKAWLKFCGKSKGSLKIDEGAYKALLQGSSLLPVGIKEIEGEFKRGDMVSIIHNSMPVAQGLVEFSSSELLTIKGRPSQIWRTELPLSPSDEAIHRDNLIVH